MIRFSQADDNKQFISVKCAVAEDVVIPLVYFGTHTRAANIRYSENELVVEIPESGFGFPLRDLRAMVPGATVSTFCVDLDLASQRCYP